MEFVVLFETESYENIIELSCETGYDIVEMVRKINKEVAIEDITIECRTQSRKVRCNLTEEQVKKSLVFKNCVFITVVCEPLYLNKYLYKKTEISYKDTYKLKKSLFGKEKSVIAKKPCAYVSYEIDRKRLVDDWIEMGCPLVMGNVKNPFSEKED